MSFDRSHPTPTRVRSGQDCPPFRSRIEKPDRRPRIVTRRHDASREPAREWDRTLRRWGCLVCSWMWRVSGAPGRRGKRGHNLLEGTTVELRRSRGTKRLSTASHPWPSSWVTRSSGSHHFRGTLRPERFHVHAARHVGRSLLRHPPQVHEQRDQRGMPELWSRNARGRRLRD